ncbi:putative P-loop containing nucleoside triphosphate hydrolase, leucine-rich repeat domain superfamily [Helianthus annuus]|nr:putative P-loop containing nucleoside triphosphate hydrolase, leucine-rich repeat domain superfamily [Helianthus annuus]
MAYAGIQMLMEELKQLINCIDNPLINNPSIICERPQFQLLYDKLDSMMRTLFIDEHQDLHDIDKLNDLKRRFIDTAEEAQYIVDIFLSSVHIRNTTQDFPTSDDFSPSLNLDEVGRSLNSIKVEFMSVFIDSMNMDSSIRPERTLDQSAAAQILFTRNSKGSKKLMDEMVVGIDCDAELIRDKLVEDQKKLDVVSIVGMGGIGKTTLATKVFDDGYVKHHFHVRVWVTVSQTYGKRDVLVQILDSMGVKLDLEKASDSRLRELVHKYLMGKRYLIVIDDIWHKETWDKIKLVFPCNNSGSRILLTTRVTEVAKRANRDGLIHHLGYLNKEKSWELLCQKVFHDNECPEWSIKPGMQIAENCQGLPLAVVVISGVLAKEAWNEKFWVEIAERTGSYVVGNGNGCLETLALSYNHLPLHLRECFLYLGGFPEDQKFQVERLIWLWVAEGFIVQVGSRSLEEIAEGYLMDLIDRNLVIVADRRNSNGTVIACKVHDLVRELCLTKAKEERFILKTERLIMSSRFSDVITPPYKPVRMFINKDINILGFPFWSSQNLRSVLCFSNFRPLSDEIAKCFRSFVLLRVLDLQKWRLSDLPHNMELLVHLRYLAIWNSSAGACRLPWSDMSIIHSLPNLQVLKLRRSAFEGSCWNTNEHVFRQLKFMRLKMLDIKLWKAYSLSFPCLRQLEIFHCYHLEGIPLDIGDIPTLEIIKIKYCRHSVGESVTRIQEEQRDFGNYELKIDVTPFQK